MTLYLHEFLYRGRSPDSAEPPTYHVQLASEGQDAFGAPILSVTQAMTPERAEAMGFVLPEIGSAIDYRLMKENAALHAALMLLQVERDALQDKINALSANKAAPEEANS